MITHYRRSLWKKWGSACSKLLMSRIGSDRYIFLVLLLAGTLKVLMWFDFVCKGSKRSSSVCSGFWDPLTLKANLYFLLLSFLCCSLPWVKSNTRRKKYPGYWPNLVGVISTYKVLTFISIFLHSHDVLDRGALRSSICKSPFSPRFSRRVWVKSGALAAHLQHFGPASFLPNASLG